MDIMEAIGGIVGPFFDFQRWADGFGVKLEDFQEIEAKNILEDPQYKIYFSIPESWDDTFGEVDAEQIKKEFKSQFNNAMIQLWKSQDEPFDDDFLDFCISKFKYLCRVRKGQTWTNDDRTRTLVDTEKRIAEAMLKLKEKTEYEEA